MDLHSLCKEFLINGYTVGHARTNIIGYRTSFVIASVRSNIQ